MGVCQGPTGTCKDLAAGALPEAIGGLAPSTEDPAAKHFQAAILELARGRLPQVL